MIATIYAVQNFNIGDDANRDPMFNEVVDQVARRLNVVK
jgi:hypothetical protein